MKNYVILIATVLFLTSRIKSSTYYPNCSRSQTYCISNKLCINSKLICNNEQDCTDGSDEDGCVDRKVDYKSRNLKSPLILREYPRCSDSYVQCRSNKDCIPKNWICDDQQDCSDGSDEYKCLKTGLRIEDIRGLNESRKKAREWIYKQRRSDWGWGKDTNRAIVTLRLSDDNDFILSNLTSQIMDKEMKLQLAVALLLNNQYFKKFIEIALYVHSLLATCSNPKNFQGFNLVKILQENMEKAKLINPMAALVICNGNGSLDSRQILKLREIIFKENQPPLLDVSLYAIMALNCVKNKIAFHRENFGEMSTEDENDFLDFDNVTEKLIKLQNVDGSFGNVYTTSLMMHMLLSTKNLNNAEWDIEKSYRYLISEQREDGSFGDILATYLILPLMNGKTFLDLGKMKCSIENPNLTNLTVEEELYSRNINKHHVQYFVNVGKDNDISFSISLHVPITSTFYEVMRLAAELDPRFRFKYTNYPWGKYVYSIFGIVNNPESKNYWQLYKNIGNSPSLTVQQSPDKIISEENTTYIFWYKMIQL